MNLSKEESKFSKDNLGICWNSYSIADALWPKDIDNKQYSFSCWDFWVTDKINFYDDIWDFVTEKPVEHHRKDKYYYDFSKIDSNYKNYLKLFVLRERKESENSFPTVHQAYKNNKKFIVFLESKLVFNYELITQEILMEFFSTLSVAERTKGKYRWDIGSFLKEIVFRNTFLHLEDCFEWLEEEDNMSEIKIRAEEEMGKSNLIPFKFYNRLVTIAMRVIMNKNSSILDKMSACSIIILGETGLRIGEFRLLEFGRLEEVEMEKLEGSQWALEFWTYKVRKRWTWTVLTEISKFAIDKLTETLSERRKKSLYLYVNDKGELYPQGTIRRHVVRFFLKHQNELFDDIECEDLEQFESTIITKSLAHIYGQVYSGKTYYYAHPHQFRVLCATKLAMKYPLMWIKEYMNHMMEDMTQHYIRDSVFKEKILRSAELLEDTLKQRSNETGDKLEMRPEMIDDEEIVVELDDKECIKSYEVINKFLKKNRFNIFKDVDEIIKKLQGVGLPLMEMEIGFCASIALNSLCERQNHLKYIREQNEFINVQMPNLATLHITYLRFKEKVKIVKYNNEISKKNDKYKKAYLDERNSLTDFIKERLLPEIIKLKEKLDNGKKELVLNKYPKLRVILLNLPKIEKEVKEWI